MKRSYLQLKKAILFLSVFLIYSLVFIRDAPAPPLPPDPPAVPAGGDIAQALAIGAIVVYGVWRLLRKR
jgi:hypothetical protein